MKLLPLLSVALLASCSTLRDYTPGGGDLRERAAVNIGQRVFSAHSANYVDEQPNLGFEYSTWREDGAFGYDFGVNYHSDRADMPVFGNTVFRGWEATAGLRRSFEIEGFPITPYIGAGLTGWWADRDEEVNSPRDGEETGVGIYERVGITMPVSKRSFIGIDVRYVQENFIHEGDLSMNGDIVSLTFGIII
jgi:hypothetical protein